MTVATSRKELPHDDTAPQAPQAFRGMTQQPSRHSAAVQWWYQRFTLAIPRCVSHLLDDFVTTVFDLRTPSRHRVKRRVHRLARGDPPPRLVSSLAADRRPERCSLDAQRPFRKRAPLVDRRAMLMLVGANRCLPRGSTPARCRAGINGTYGRRGKAVAVSPPAALLSLAIDPGGASGAAASRPYHLVGADGKLLRKSDTERLSGSKTMQ